MKLFLASTVLLFLNSLSFAQTQSLKPYYAKISVLQTAPFNECTRHAEKVKLALLQEMKAAPLSSQHTPYFFQQQGSTCLGLFYLSFESPPSPTRVAQLMKRFGFQMQSLVDNSKGTYMTWVASVMTLQGSIQNCVSRRQATRSFPNLTVGYQTLNAEMNQVLGWDKLRQQKWIQENFQCPGNYQNFPIQISMELTNQTPCPLQAETFHRCFIARGFRAIQLN